MNFKVPWVEHTKAAQRDRILEGVRIWSEQLHSVCISVNAGLEDILFESQEIMETIPGFKILSVCKTLGGDWTRVAASLITIRQKLPKAHTCLLELETPMKTFLDEWKNDELSLWTLQRFEQNLLSLVHLGFEQFILYPGIKGQELSTVSATSAFAAVAARVLPNVKLTTRLYAYHPAPADAALGHRMIRAITRPLPVPLMYSIDPSQANQWKVPEAVAYDTGHPMSLLYPGYLRWVEAARELQSGEQKKRHSQLIALAEAERVEQMEYLKKSTTPSFVETGEISEEVV